MAALAADIAAPRPVGGGDMAAPHPQSVALDASVERAISGMCIHCVVNKEEWHGLSSANLRDEVLNRVIVLLGVDECARLRDRARLGAEDGLSAREKSIAERKLSENVLR